MHRVSFVSFVCCRRQYATCQDFAYAGLGFHLPLSHLYGCTFEMRRVNFALAARLSFRESKALNPSYKTKLSSVFLKCTPHLYQEIIIDFIELPQFHALIVRAMQKSSVQICLFVFTFGIALKSAIFYE